MHAWSEVEHDLVYKPLEGRLSAPEYALLDQLNGLVLAGEIALEQLQLAGDARLTAPQAAFRNHYELAEYIRTKLATGKTDLTDSTLGRVDALFTFLAAENLATTSSIDSYLAQLTRDFEKRPVADQLADLMLSGNKARYTAYLDAISTSRHSPGSRRMTLSQLKSDSPEKFALGEFITEWTLLELQLKNLVQAMEPPFPSLAEILRRLLTQEIITREQFEELDFMRRLRNRVVHGNTEDITADQLKEASASLRTLRKTMENRS